ncbi:ZC21C protein, partial [Atractosteus spatula]|nr:ZC21C protein [Atractosteus spatula]
MEEKEKKMIAIYNRQQEAALQKMRNSFQYAKYASEKKTGNSYRFQAQQGSEKNIVGYDRSYPLKPIGNRKVSGPGEVRAVERPEVQRDSLFVPTPPQDGCERPCERPGRRGSRVRKPKDRTVVPMVATPPGECPSHANGKEHFRLQEEQRKVAEAEAALKEEHRRREASLRDEMRRKEATMQAKLFRAQEELRRVQREMEDSREVARRENRGLLTRRKTLQARQSELRPRGLCAESHFPSALSHQERCQVSPCSRGLEDVPCGRKKYLKKARLPESDVSAAQATQAHFRNNTACLDEQTLSVKNGYLSPTSLMCPTAKQFPYENSQSGNPQLVPCELCHRKFAVERLEKHSKICEKLQNSKRKVFDSCKHRAKGTELETYIHKKKVKPPIVLRKNNWRQKHEDFIRSIKQAREVQQVITQGGKVVNLPQPPANPNPDYVPCPHCGRRFAPRPAQRHIPKCQHIRSRPPPPPPPRG